MVCSTEEEEAALMFGLELAERLFIRLISHHLKVLPESPNWRQQIGKTWLLLLI